MQRIKSNAAIRAELAELAKQHGKLTEELVVKASRSKKSALHKLFLWGDQASAAHLGRLEIARQLIISIRIERVEQKELNCAVRVRKYHGLGDGYIPIGQVLSKEKLRQQLLDRALEDLTDMLRRYETLSELDPIRKTIDSIKKKRRK